MEFLTQLWLPILVAAVLVFLVSSVVHMATPMHKSDKKPLPNETAVMDALRTAGVTPGAYVFPGICSMKEMGTPEAKAKYERGPIGLVTVLPTGVPAIGKALMQWFIFTLLVGVLTAYVAWHTLPPGTDYLRVFQVTGAVAFMAYGIGVIDDSIWKGQPWSSTWKFLFDGLLYALATAGAFGWLWPHP